MQQAMCAGDLTCQVDHPPNGPNRGGEGVGMLMPSSFFLSLLSSRAVESDGLSRGIRRLLCEVWGKLRWFGLVVLGLGVAALLCDFGRGGR
jgi:hypothetical protein